MPRFLSLDQGARIAVQGARLALGPNDVGCRQIHVKFERLGTAAPAPAPCPSPGINRAFSSGKKSWWQSEPIHYRGVWAVRWCSDHGHQGVRRMAGLGPVPGQFSVSGVASFPARTGGRFMPPRRTRRCMKSELDPSISEFPSATLLPCNSKIAVRSSCRHDMASALVTSWRLHRHSRRSNNFSRSRLGGTHAAQH